MNDGADERALGRVWVAVLGLVVLADISVYRGQGYAGYSVLFLIGPMLFLRAAPRAGVAGSAWLVLAMLVTLAGRAVWCGSPLQVAIGLALLVALTLTLHGRNPRLPDVLEHALQALPAGLLRLPRVLPTFASAEISAGRLFPLRVMLPLATLSLFGTIFVLANPDLGRSLSECIERVFTTLISFMQRGGPGVGELGFCGVVALAAIGLLYPVTGSPSARRKSLDSDPATIESELFDPLRNMLVAVIVLFGVYLGFEFNTLWFRVFPRGFYYAGYAHQGAAWLTIALGVATVVLSLTFRGEVLADPRLSRLRRLAWVWSLQNLLLALAVYNRLCIYIGYNGMTRMRTIGLLGITAVVLGFALVVWKIRRNHDASWLLHRQLWTLAFVVYAYAVLPVDALVHGYNVRRVLAGDLSPAVQISVHPLDAEGYLMLAPLLRSSDPLIREGILAMLASRELQCEARSREVAKLGWTAIQYSEDLLLLQLRSERALWSEYADQARRDGALQKFRGYVYQWY